MTRTTRLGGPVALGAVLVLAGCSATTDPSPAADGGPDRCPSQGEAFAGDTRLYLEHNATDQDTGVHGTFGQDGLARVCIRGPDGGDVLRVDPVGHLGDLGVDEFFFESREPPAADYPIERLRAEFPEGAYTVSGRDRQGTARSGTARFTHDIPAAPVITSPDLADEESAGDVVVPTTGLTVRWEPVTRTLDGAPVTITAYEVVVTEVGHEDPDGLSLPEYDVHVPPETDELAVVDGFLRPATVYEVEVLALEDSGNQTISLGFFTTAG